MGLNITENTVRKSTQRIPRRASGKELTNLYHLGCSQLYTKQINLAQMIRIYVISDCKMPKVSGCRDRGFSSSEQWLHSHAGHKTAAAAPGITSRHSNDQRKKGNLLFVCFLEARKPFKETPSTLAHSLIHHWQEHRNAMMGSVGRIGYKGISWNDHGGVHWMPGNPPQQPLHPKHTCLLSTQFLKLPWCR